MEGVAHISLFDTCAASAESWLWLSACARYPQLVVQTGSNDLQVLTWW